MSEFKELIQDTKSSLADLEVLLQRAKSLTTPLSERMAPSREAVQTPLDAIIRAIEELANRLREKEALQQTERRNLHLQMEKVRVKIEHAIDQLEEALGCKPVDVSQVQRGQEEGGLSSLSNDTSRDRAALSVGEYVSQGELLLQRSQYAACFELMTLALTEHPGTEGIHELVRECRRHLEDLQLQEEMVIYLENLKKEAADQFDREQFQECAKTFGFLCELEPDNRVLQEYLKLSQQQVLETEGVSLPEENSALQLTIMDTMAVREAMSSSTDLAIPPSEPPESNEDLRSADGNQKENVEGKDTSPAKPHKEMASDRELVKHWSSALTDWKTLCVAGSLIALVLILGAHKLLKSEASLGGTLTVQSEPPDSTAFVNGIARGQTPLSLQSLEPGSYDIRIQKDGHLSYCSKITLERNQPNLVSVRLETWPAQAISENSHLLSLKSLSAGGNLIEGLEVCERILKVSPKNRALRTLKASLRNQLFEQIDEAANGGRWRAAQDKLNALLRVSPADRVARKRLRLVQTKLQPDLTTTVNAGPSSNVQVEELQRRISSAIASSKYFPPHSGNALELTRSLKQLVPQSSFAEERLDLIRGKTSRQAQLMIQAGDLEGARTLVHQLETYFPDGSELGALTESVKSHDAAVAEVNTTVAKAEAALASRHFVVPLNECAFSLSNRVLRLAPNNQRAQSIRKDSVARALVEAKGWTADGKYDEARQVYLAVSQILSTHKDLPFSAREVTDQVERLEFMALPVIHDHALGSCTGTLKFNGYVIAFLPTGGSKDGFEQRLSEIEKREFSDKLGLHFRGKTYRFGPSRVEGKEEGRQKLKEIYERLSKLVEK
ncbi:MAG: PEGA domain-containing protein [Acidobacteria bacterium]|nr:PEGA domain-containing protein [Acidobacteriota bacterium]